MLAQSVIPEIAFHSVAGELPARAARRVINLEQTRLVTCNQVMFFRPLGQSAIHLPDDAAAAPVDIGAAPRPQGREPIVALLDGLPLVNHVVLDGRITLDDPEAWSQNYAANERIHGTMMASLIAHGELDGHEPPLPTPIYARPIMRPDRADWRGTPVETIPEDIIPEDLIHRAIVRIFSGENGRPPVAPSVRAISLAIGDPSVLFDRVMSPLARLLDWLAWRFQILFLVSAGNHARDIELEIPRGQLRQLTPQQLESAMITALEADSLNRRLLSPAEAINALTVGAVHSDSSALVGGGPRINPFASHDLPSPINALGLGYRRAVKPDLLLPGGRQLFTERPGNAHANETLQVLGHTTRPPGHRAAAPGGPGNLAATRFYRGTSNSTAIATRKAAQLYELLRTLQAQPNGRALSERFTAVTLKALLVHGCSWDGAIAVIAPVLEALPGRPPLRQCAARFLGYGVSQTDRVFSCTEERATLIGCGELLDGEAHIYRVPIPPSLSGQLVWRRLTLTLAWLTPVNPLDRFYRRASLWFAPPEEELMIRRSQVDWQMAQRGTVQHEILEGDQATVFVRNQALSIQVNCRAQTGRLEEIVPYALAVSLEVAEGTGIPIYNEIRARLAVGVRIGAAGPIEP